MGTPLPEGIVAIVKADCPTCQLVAPVLGELRAAGVALTVFTQDDPAFPEGLDPVDDTELDVSAALDLDTVPTLIKVEGGSEVDRLVGWSRPHWQKFTGVEPLGDGLPEFRPGCGSLTTDPAVIERLAARSTGLRSRRLELARLEDEAEAFFERGWTDGLPVVPPTPARVLRMLEGTSRAADEVVATVGPDFADCTVEKAAVNAVLAGCRPEYFPVVLAAVEAACTDEFNMHGLLCTTWFCGPVIIVNGPIATENGMNSGVNALGQGNRANATIGRALQLIVRNIGGGRPGEIDRATLGGPGKYTFCFAEDEAGSPWEPLSVERGFAEGTSTVTLFAGEGPNGMCDQKSRDPESLARSMAWALDAVWHPKLAMITDAVLVVVAGARPGVPGGGLVESPTPGAAPGAGYEAAVGDRRRRPGLRRRHGLRAGRCEERLRRRRGRRRNDRSRRGPDPQVRARRAADRPRRRERRALLGRHRRLGRGAIGSSPVTREVKR